MSQFGVHIDPPLAAVPAELAALGLTVFQTTLRDPRRLSKDGVPDADDQAAFVEAVASAPPDLWGMAHASMLTSLGSPDPKIRNASASTLAADANLAAALGLKGVCFHVGYEKGHATREAALDAVVYKLKDVVGRLKPGARVFIENGCEGTELGQTIAELGYVVRQCEPPVESLGITLDTCHLHVAGFDLAAADAPDRLADQLMEHGVTRFLASLHLNDAREPCGSHRDRHAIPGQGTIGEGLRRIVAHPMFAGLPSILELGVEDAMVGIAFLSGPPIE